MASATEESLGQTELEEFIWSLEIGRGVDSVLFAEVDRMRAKRVV